MKQWYMPSPEEEIFSDNTVYISSTRLTIIKSGTTYQIANLTQVTFARMADNRSWLPPLLFGILFLGLGEVLYQNAIVATHSVLPGSYLFVAIGCLSIIGGFARTVYQVCNPLYVVMLKGSFGTAKPIKSRNRDYVMKIIEKLNLAIHRRTSASPTIVNPIHIAGVKGSQINIAPQGTISNPRFTHPSPNESSLRPMDYRPQEDHPGKMANDRGASPTPTWPQTMLPGAAKRKIIISYNHKDRECLDRLKTHLSPLAHQWGIAFWDDTQSVGMPAQQALQNALKDAEFALLLVSADFLASNVELSLILQRFAQGQLRLLPLILSPCLYQESPLGKYQPFNPDRALSTLSISEREEMFVNVTRTIQKSLQGTVP